ncbi:MAG TPA: hsp70 family protein, partial [Pilimelia sp.]|nr:hsp70 family protein [Pilimelia sp.]
MTTTRLAIDLGTSHTVGVVRREGQQVRALLFDGSPLLPSGVAAGADGTLHTGRDAERIAQVEPDRFEPHPKRRVDEGSVLLGDRVIAVSDMLAAILGRVVAEARTAGVAAGGGTVLTCPADWGGPRRDVLREAARRAGLGDAVLVDEPVAAAAYCMGVVGQQLYTGQALAVFDFGGGTLDVTVVRRDPDQLRVLATGGLDDLGGLDIDAAVVGHLGHLIELRDPALWQRLRAPGDAAQARDRRAFWAEARAAKEMLSRTSSAPVQVPGRPDALHLTRDELERIAGPLIARAVDETRRVVERAGAGQLAGILLVGGSSRIPLVASRLHARLGVAPTTPEQPELPVAHGALLLTGLGRWPVGPGQQVAGRPGQQVARPPGPVSTSGSPAAAPWPEPGTVSGSPLFGSPVSGPSSVPPYAGLGSGPPISPAVPPPGPASRPGPQPPGSQPPNPPGPQPPHPPLPHPPGPQPPDPPGSRPPAGPGGMAQPWQAATPPGKRGRRVAVAAAAATIVMIMLITAGLTGVLRKILDGTGSGNALDGIGTALGGDRGGSGQLKVVAEVPVGAGGGAVATDGETGYYATSGASTTKVEALPAGGGKPRWTATVRFGAARLRLTVVNGLLILDGQQSTLELDARAVVDARNGKVLWSKQWYDRFDLAYVGTDALVEVRERPTGVSRIDLRTGKARWTVPGPDDLFIIDDHLAKAARTWPATATARKTGDPLAPPRGNGFAESLAAGTDVVILDEGESRGKIVDGSTGKVRRSGALPLDPELWDVFDGLIIGKRNDSGGSAAIVAHRLSDLRQAWQFPLVAGSSVEAVRPCGPKRICVVAAPPGVSDDIVYAIDTTRGTKAWERQPSGLIDVGWYVVDGKLVFGEDSFGSIGEPVVIDSANK